MSQKIVLVAIVTVLAGALLIAGRTERVKADTANFTLYGSAVSGWGFTGDNITSPSPTITVNQNDYVNVTLVSQNGLPHRFFVDYDNNGGVDAGEPVSIEFTSTIAFGFNATSSGNFTYRCSFHATIMYGTIVVNQAIPESPSLLILPLFAIATLVATIVYRTKRPT